MLVILKIFFDICLLRAKPQDLPASVVLLALSLSAHVVVNLAALMGKADLSIALQAALVDTLVLVALVHSALLLRQMPARSRQTLTALTGSGALLSLLAWPVFQLVRDTNQLTFVVLLFVFWQIAVFGHILRHALSVSYFAGIAISILYIMITSFIVISLFNLTNSAEVAT